MQTVYTYIEKALSDSHWSIPWRVSYVSVAKQVIVQAYLPVDDVEDIQLLDGNNQLLGDVNYLELKFILTETSLTAQSSDEVMMIQALDNGHFTIGYLEVVFQQMNQMIHNGRLQIKELLAGQITEVAMTWPEETVAQMVATRKSVNRYDETQLQLGDDKNDVV
ncbi:hypothetical protein EF384_09200 [Aerococcus agrisoli]|uniref:Uncharacterized protein n=1 Tax=Aerococcus agrisoli TaxID=2487350 RepID=A0A3N4GS73_9LACT|nr:hypothetical protein [Aerococcus agrisoli]RPA55914.1 hypothetical protein EF384_09200 [Aerococcus agrisoli]